MRVRRTPSFVLAVFAASTAAAQNVSSARYRPLAALNDGWKTASADSLGVDSRRLAGLTESLRAWPELGVHAVLIGDSSAYSSCQASTWS